MDLSEQFLIQEKQRILKEYNCKNIDEALLLLRQIVQKQKIN